MRRTAIALLALLAPGAAPLVGKAWADAFSSVAPGVGLGGGSLGGLVVTIPTVVSGANFQPSGSVPVTANTQTEALNFVETVTSPSSSTAASIFTGWHHNFIFQGSSWINWPTNTLSDALSIWNNLEIQAPTTVTATTTALSSASTTMTLPTAGLTAGMTVNGFGILVNTTTISSITDATHMVVSPAVTVGSGVVITANVLDTIAQAKSMQNGVYISGTGAQTVSGNLWGHFNHHQITNPYAQVTTIYGYDTFIGPMAGKISNYVDYNCQNFTGQGWSTPISNMWCLYNQDVNKRIYTNGRLVATGATTVASLSMGLAADTAFTAQRAVLLSGIAPTVTTGWGTGDTIPDNSGSAYFSVLVGTTPGTTAVLAMNKTATTGWDCTAQDYTTPGSFVFSQSGRSTTTATLISYSRTTGTATAPTAADRIGVRCVGD